MQNQVLTMVVTNTHQVESGVSPKMRWDETGGSIGSDSTDEWVLKDRHDNVKPSHCTVVMVDGGFCIKDNCGETYVNGSSMPLGKFGMAKLADKDMLQIGPYSIRVELNSEEKDSPIHQELDQLIFSHSDGLLDDYGVEDKALVMAEAKQQQLSDPLIALEETRVIAEEDKSLIDPEDEEEENEEQEESLLPEMESDYQEPEIIGTYESNSENQLGSAIGIKRILGIGRFMHRKKNSDPISQETAQEPVSDSEPANNTIPQENNVSGYTYRQSEGGVMDENVLDLLEEEVGKSFEPAATNPIKINEGSTHILTGPILRGMGVESLGTPDMIEMQALSEELGASLKACIEGLLELHDQVSHGRFGMMNRNLQPIEDNPLRLGLNYVETVETMYDTEQSMVHLSAPAAIAESLKNVRDHNDAVQHATTQALQQILVAFSPQVLLRRFKHYRRTAEASPLEGDSWAWEMYCNYYKELTSSRQQGFEKLFWEIFEQAYDKKIREKQLEF